MAGSLDARHAAGAGACLMHPPSTVARQGHGRGDVGGCSGSTGGLLSWVAHTEVRAATPTFPVGRRGASRGGTFLAPPAASPSRGSSVRSRPQGGGCGGDFKAMGERATRKAEAAGTQRGPLRRQRGRHSMAGARL